MTETSDRATPATVPATFAVRARAIAWSFFANAIVASAIGLAWITDAGASFGPALYAHAALVSTVATLALVPFALLVVLALVVRGPRALAWTSSIAWTLFLVLVYADTVVYGLFRYHFNGMVWNVLTTPGAEDAVAIDASTWWRIGVGAIVVLVLELVAWKRVLAPLARAERGTSARRALRWSAMALALVVAGEKCAYARADLERDRAITARAGMFPLYQRFTVARFAERVFGKKPAKETPSLAVAPEGVLLRYPIEAPVLDARGKRPNVLLVVIDSLRADMLAEETMPRTSELARTSRTFANHLSGGNATRYGVFSMLYGIHGAYWKSVLEEGTPPVLVTALQRAGYDLRAYSGPSQSYPEFRSTCWVTIEEKVEDGLVRAAGDSRDKIAAKIAGDREVARRFEAWMSERAASRDAKPPFFAFALIDAPHGSYAWPREDTRFTPVADAVDYLQLARSPTKAEIEPVWNMYRNAVRYADSLVGRMLDALRASGELENTIVVVTGDHGEEFFEHGFFGHTSNFAPEQVHVACVIAGPGFAPGVERRPTSHIDLAPTILATLGADPATFDRWTQGTDLRSPPERRVRTIASWDELALWVDGGILRIPIEGHRGLVEAYDADWKRKDDEDAFVRAHAADVANLARECRRFLR